MDKIREYVDKEIADGIPYLDVAAYREGKEIYRYYNGKGGANGKEKLLMFSCTKPMTASLIMKLIEEGKLTLDTRIGDIIPEYKEAYLLNSEGKRVKPENELTVYHMLTMTGGLSYDRFRYPIKEALENKGDRSDTVAAIASLAKSPLLFEPGTRFQYSLCHDVLGAVIEVVSGMSFSEYAKKTILAPLGMNDTYFCAPKDNDVADVYISDSKGNITKTKKDNPLVFSDGYESGGASLISTVDDYSKLAVMLSLGGVTPDGVRILSEESVKELYTPRISGIDINSGFTCIQGDDYAYGLGVRTRIKETEWGLPIGEFGWDGAAGSYLMVDSKNKIAVVIGMHVREWPKVFKGKHLEIVKRIYEKFGIS